MLRHVIVPLTLSVLALTTVPCGAQVVPPNSPLSRAATLRELDKVKVTLKLEDASEHQAVEALFKKVELNYVYILDPLVATRITLSVEGVPFEGALVSIVRSVPRDPLRYTQASPEILAITPDRAVGITTNLPGRRVWLDFDHVDVRYALKALFQAGVANYTLDQSAQGTVTLKLKQVPFEDAIKEVLGAVSGGPKLAMVFDDGIYKVTPKP